MGERVISFDIDGTLVHPEYNDLIWHKAIPEMVAEKRSISFDESRAIVQEEYDIIGEQDFRWYDIKYWIDYFQLSIDYNELLQRYEQQIIIFSDVCPVLEQLAQKYKLICISSMPQEFLDIKIKKFKTFFKETFSTLSEYKELKNKEIFIHICKKLKTSPEKILHIGDSVKKDYLAAQKAGWKALLIDRFCTGLQEKYPDSVIHNLSELVNKIETIF